jgi:hypothetical protein
MITTQVPGQTATVPTLLGPITITLGVLDDTSIRAYSFGQCHALAIALSQYLHTTPQVVVHLLDTEFLSPEEELKEMELCYQEEMCYEPFEAPQNEPDYAWSDYELADTWEHAVVEIEPGRYLDIDGIKTLSQLVSSGTEDEREYMVVPVAAASLAEFHTHDEYSGLAPQVDVARSFVRPLLERYAPHLV